MAQYDDRVRGLTLIQPWADLIASGQKKIETRTWPTNWRGWLLIHAGMRWTPEERDVAGLYRAARALVSVDPVRGAIVAVAKLVDCRPLLNEPDEIRAATSLRASAVDAGRLYGVNCKGGVVPGRFAWVLDRVQALTEPVKHSGAQGLWRVPLEVMDQVRCRVLRP